LQLQNNTNHPKIGKNGTQNCLVMGINKATITKLARNVLNNGLGNAIIERQKMANMVNSKYCPSYKLHLCFLNARNVSFGSKLVSNLVITDAGETLEFIRAFVARHFRRSR
jgi:hypothetical protein